MYEIERKFLVSYIPEEIYNYNHSIIIQSYLSKNPVIRIRKIDDDYFLTYKSKGLLKRKELNYPITKEDFYQLLAKRKYISKKRYFYPYSKYLIELDVFLDELDGLIIAEVEFDSEEDAKEFVQPAWFYKEVTNNPSYQNSNLITRRPNEKKDS